MAPTTPTRSASSPGCLGAGGPVWYAVLAISFLSCSLNPVGAAGLAMRLLTPHDIYSKPIGWALTASSFVVAMMGFIATERIAYLERNRRALEIASLLAIGAGVLAFALGLTLPSIIMWPIAALIVLIGACGFRGTRGLPIPGTPGIGSREAVAVHSHGMASRPAERVARDALSGAASPVLAPKRRRRRRRRKPRAPASPPPSGGGD